MPECEMCGTRTTKLTKVRIESAVLLVCDSCVKYGIPVERKRETVKSIILPPPPIASSRPQVAKKPPVKRSVSDKDMENTMLVDDYGELIKNAREKIGWTQDDLAKKIMERKNVLSSIERNALMPDLRTARKLEKTLGIRLIEKVQ